MVHGVVVQMRTETSRPASSGTRAASSAPRSRSELKLDVDGRRRVILVLDLGLGQRRPAVDAPVDRLLALVDEAVFDELPQRPCDVRLVPIVHRHVRPVPLAEDHEALELLRHDADEALRVGAAGATDVGARHLALLRSELAIDTQLDRESVAVVSRHERRVVARPWSAT